MNQTYKLGPAQSLSVFPGDKVDMEVWEYHEGSSGYGTTSTAIASLISNVAGIFGGVSGGLGEAGLKYTGVSNAVNTFGTGGNQGDARPAAYLNYILFDKNYKVLDAGWQLAPAKDKKGTVLSLWSCESATLSKTGSSLAQMISAAHPNILVTGADGYVSYGQTWLGSYEIMRISCQLGSSKNDGSLVGYRNGVEV